MWIYSGLTLSESAHLQRDFLRSRPTEITRDSILIRDVRTSPESSSPADSVHRTPSSCLRPEVS